MDTDNRSGLGGGDIYFLSHPPLTFSRPQCLALCYLCSLNGPSHRQSGNELRLGLGSSDPTLCICSVTQFSCHIFEMGVEIADIYNALTMYPDPVPIALPL